ncbi:MAG: 2-C-methyl-D-erythritol 4-phosphate cytidylyltransferase [Acidimicrobiales bacterium]
MSVWAIVVAGGKGLRLGADQPKQFLEIAGRRVLDWSVDAARSVADGVVVVLPRAGRRRRAARARRRCGGGRRGPEAPTRWRAGLAAVPEAATIVVVHGSASCGLA